MTQPKGRKSLEPWLKDEVDFFPHQIAGVRFMLKRQNLIQGDDMGLGKSLQSLATFATDIKMGWDEGRGTMIVVAPVTLKQNWANEIEKFTRFPYVMLGEEISPRTGRPRKLSKDERDIQIINFAIGSEPRILLVNYEQVAPHLDMLNAVNAHMIVFDEAHMIGNEGANRTKACMMLKARRKIPMTGTPVARHVDNLWPLLRMCDPAGTPRFATFMNRHAVYGGYKNKSVIGVKNKEVLHGQLEHLMLRRLKADVLDLPDVHKIQVYVELSAKQRELYDEVQQEFELTAPAIDPDKPEKIGNYLLQGLRFKQICGSTMPFTGEDHSNKLTEVVSKALELIDNGHKVVIFTQFRAIADLARQRLEASRKTLPIWQLHGDVPKADRVPLIDEWGAQKAPGVLIAGLQVAAVGLNFTKARYAIFIDKLYSPAQNQQAIDRLHRIGASKTQPVTIIEFITRGTVEERVEEICQMKIGIHNELIEDVEVNEEIQRLTAMAMRDDARRRAAQQAQEAAA